MKKSIVKESTTKEMTLDEALKLGRVFVRNRTKPKGPISLTLMHPSGKTAAINIPKTYIPIELTAQVPISLLEQSVDFRAYINSKVIELVHPDDAKSVLETKEGKAEYNKIFASKYSETSDKIKAKMEKIATPGADSDEDEEEKPSDKVVDILIRQMKPIDTLNEFKSIEEELTDIDFRHIADTTGGKLRRWALKRLGKKK